MSKGNPFRPSFGTSPPLLVGRDQVVTAFTDALDAGPGSPGRASLYVGSRGVGKTVMLNAIEDEARARGWIVVSETATRGLVDRIVAEGLPRAMQLLELGGTQRKLTGVTLPMQAGGATFDVQRGIAPQQALRPLINELTDKLDANDTGLLFTIDEIQRGARQDLEAIITAVQHSFREERPVALAAAGLPSAVQDLLSNRVLTFLRRAERHDLSVVPEADVSDALEIPIRKAGRDIAPDALQVAAHGTGGYPFLIQLIGHWVWRQDEDAAVITAEHAKAGVRAARRRMGSLIHEPAIFDLSAIDRSFLAAMASVSDGPASMKDVADRLHVDRNYASQYRLRLIASAMIKPVGRGYVDFALPYLREYLQEHAATLGLDVESHGDD